MELVKTTYRLSKKDIGDAIVHWIGMFKEKQLFFPFHIHKTELPLDLPENVDIELRMTPKGSNEDEYPHNI